MSGGSEDQKRKEVLELFQELEDALVKTGIQINLKDASEEQRIQALQNAALYCLKLNAKETKPPPPSGGGGNTSSS